LREREIRKGGTCGGRQASESVLFDSTLRRKASMTEEGYARVGAVASLRETLGSVLDGANNL
jgi:hypothetical protein